MDDDYHSSRRARIERFRACLERMERRAHEEAQGSSFLILSDRPDEPPSPPGTARRFVQFCFEYQWFALDLPDVTLSRPEARRLLRDRRGFFREAEVATAAVSTLPDLVTFDPVCRKYLYGEQPQAAEDLAYVWFDLWRYPVDTTLYMRAASFEGDYDWDRDTPLA